MKLRWHFVKKTIRQVIKSKLNTVESTANQIFNVRVDAIQHPSSGPFIGEVRADLETDG